MNSDLQAFLAKHVRPYDPETDDYERPPFAADIKEGKNDPIYNAHSYHTKVPPRSIIPYILHYTKPGDVVLDPFCGSGMTGVAAQMCSDPPKDILEQFPDLADRVGPRACILNDLSPAACHIAYNYNTPVDVEALKSEFERIKAAVKEEFDWLYGTEHYEPAVGVYAPTQPEVASRLRSPPASVPANAILDEVEPTWELISREEVEKRLGYPVTELPRDDKWGKLDVATVDQWVCIPTTIEFTVWADVHRCEGFVQLSEPVVNAHGKTVMRKTKVARGCGKEINLWSAAVDSGRVLDEFPCPHCEQVWHKGNLSRLKSAPVLTRYEFVDHRRKSVARQRPVTRIERELVAKIDSTPVSQWFPKEPWDETREMWRGGHRDAGIKTTADFYTRRSLRALALVWEEVSKVQEERIRRALQFLLTSVSPSYAKTTRYNFGRRGNGGISGTLYVASFTVENSLPRISGNKWPDVLVAFEAATRRAAKCRVIRGSAGEVSRVADASIDYIFTDPPFGSNIFYADCSFLWESWLGEMTSLTEEAVWNKSVTSQEGGKSLFDYERLMAASFAEMYRVLKPGRWCTVEFNNSDGTVFQAIKRAVEAAGFEIANMLLLDKAQKSFKQTKGAAGEEDVVDKDVLFNLHKPAAVIRETRSEDSDLEQQIADAVREHLATLPERMTAEPGKYSDDHRTTATINSMLMNNLIPRGVSVERLNLPFIERVCARYFRKIGQRWYLRGETIGGNGGDLVTEEVAVTDELSAVAWLRQQILSAPKLTGELKPLWMRATGLLPAVVSRTLDLERLLRENFWRDTETNRWREPTAEERDKMGDDRSLRVLHDADRLASGSFGRVPSGAEICDWITVLFDTCKELEEDPSAQSAHLGFDKTEAYRLIVKISHHLTADGVDPAKLSAARKQAAVAGRRLAEAAESSDTTGSTKRRKDDNQPVLDLGI
jgi:DNA modification methylase